MRAGGGPRNPLHSGADWVRRGQKHNGRFVPGVPAWIQQREALFEKYDRRLDRLVDPGGEPADQPSVLYHYTTWEGFEGILKSQEFWAFDHRDMKDPRELRPAEDAIKNVLAEMQATTDGPLRDLVDLVSASYPMRLAADFVIVYLTCFSRARDKFYFWEQRNEGVCLGIPVLRNEQLPTVPKLGRQMMKVEYEFSGWREDLRACFRKMLDAYAAFLAEPQKWDLLPRMTELTKNAFERFAAKTSIASKDRIPYEAEEEWRYIALPFGRDSGPPARYIERAST